MFQESENIELPAGAETFDNSEKVHSFDAALAETKTILQGETATQVKRKRGRPKKAPTNDPQATQTAPPMPGPTHAEAIPQMDFKPFLNQSLKMPFKVWAKKAKCPGIEVTDAELEAPVIYADQMLNYYGPRLESLDPGKTAMVMFCISMLMLVGDKASVIADSEPKVEQTVQTQGPNEPVNTETAKTPVPVMPEGGVLYNSGRA